MPSLRFDHMELTVPKGALERDRADIRDFYVRYLLPIWFDVQVIESAAGRTPERVWSYGSR